MSPLALGALLALAAHAPSGRPELTLAYRSDAGAAPLFAACLHPREFRRRYGLHLEESRPRAEYRLFDGKRQTLSLRLLPYDADSLVLSALLSGRAQAGILAPEAVLAAALEGCPVKVVAPLQYRGDQLVVGKTTPARNWDEFLAWARAQARPVTAGFLGSYSMAQLGFAQALEYERLSAGDSGSVAAKVRLVRCADRAGVAAELASGRLDAAVLPEPTATKVSSAAGGRIVGRTDLLPPSRFEDRPVTIVAATDTAIRTGGEKLSRFLELLAVATHYANNRTRNTRIAVGRWLPTQPTESAALANTCFSSRPDPGFTTGLWNWYFALRRGGVLPESLSGYMEEKEWLGVAYDSLLLGPALDRAGARIIR